MCVLARTLLAVFGHDHQRLGAGHQRSILLAAALAVACGPADHPQRPLRVAAASSLTNVLPTLVRELGLEPAELRFEASSTLARQIEAGDEVDVFLSADARWADHLIEVGLADPADRTAFASNRLVVVVPRDESSLPTRLGDLRALPHVAVAGPDVPAGRLAREALAHEAVLVDADGWLVDAPNVRGALAWVALGEAEAAIVFQTDAQIEPAVRVAFEIPRADYPPAVDVGVVVRGGRETEARAFLHALSSARARTVLRAAGFDPASTVTVP